MSTGASATRLVRADVHVAFAATALLGIGVTLAAGGLSAALPLTIVAGLAMSCIGLSVLAATGVIDSIVLLVLVLPLPPLIDDGATRVAPAAVASLIVALAWILSAPSLPRVASRPVVSHYSTQVRSPSAAMRALLLMFAAIVLSALLAQQRAPAAREVINWAMLLGVFFIAKEQFSNVPPSRMVFLRTMGIVGGICGALAVLQSLGQIPGRFSLTGTSVQRATLGFGWPNEAGVFLALCIPYVAFLRTTSRTSIGRVAARAALVASVLGLIATFSRGSWLAAIVAPLILAATGEGRATVRLWLAAVAIGIVADIASGGIVGGRIASTVGDWVLEQRVALMLAGIVIFLAHPLAGVGPGGFGAGLEQYGPNVSWLWDYLPTAQNTYIQFAAETGVVGLLAYLCFITLTLIALVKSTRAWRRSNSSAEAAIRRTALWAVATAALLGFNEWIFAHGIGQLVLLSAALGLAGAESSAEIET